MSSANYLGQQIKIKADVLDFVTAKDIAKQKTKEYCAGSMLLSWFNGKTGHSKVESVVSLSGIRISMRWSKV